MKNCRWIFTCLLMLLFVQESFSHVPHRLVVDPSGKGDFISIQAAIESLPDSSSSPRTIFIKKGIYQEKLFITKENLVLEGEDRSQTRIIQSIARDQWRCDHSDDWGVATLNIRANDLTLLHLTIENRFGFDFKEPFNISCRLDAHHPLKTVQKSGHQMALRLMGGTRMKAIDCHFSAFGGDTVSPWDVEAGCFYFKDCVMEGGVDFYCPRGWAWAENCTFISHSGTAAIWHDGSKHQDSKTVLKNCRFQGFDGFLLGRYHKDAQFYLIGCEFADNMGDKPIYLVATDNVLQWGQRIYYFDCKRKAGNYAWFTNNIDASEVKKITPSWVFGQRWTFNF